MKLLTSPIFITLKSWFTPPVFEEQDKTLKARNSFFLAIVGFTTSVLIFIFFLLFSPENHFRLFVIGASVFFSLLPIVLLHKGYVQATIFFQASIIWVGVVSSSISTGGVRSIGFIGGTIAALLIMGIALERVSTLIFIFISILSAGILAWAETRGYIDATATDKPVVLVATYASFLFVLAGLLYVTYQSVTQALAKANRELTQRQHIEKVREKLIGELEHKNAELERFTYTVSHDLKSPLVTIKGFLGMLKKDMEENRQDRIQKDFDRISEAADKMATLLSELLELSRIGRIAHPPEEVDLVKLTQDALETLHGRLRARNITVTVSPDLSTVYADRNRLREVLENLIDNAAKYMGDQANPLIEIGKRESGAETILYVKDNGIGIEPQFHTKIFGLFEKLSAHSEGTGIGLALIKRIIEVHGGRIWVESEGVGKGSTFCFTIPDGRKLEYYY